MPRQHRPAIEVFISYSPEDEELRQQLESHLAVLAKQGRTRIWHGRRIPPGQDRSATTRRQLEMADLILLLMSPDFLASDELWGVDLNHALDRHQAGDARVVPVILRPCDWESTPFGKLQVLPRNHRPVVTWQNRDEAFLEVVAALRKMIEAPAAGEVSAGPLQRLLALERLLEDLESEGGEAAEVRREILDLRRRIRQGIPLQKGDLLLEDRLKLVEPIGQGGFARVWKAWDRKSREMVAIKVLHHQYADDRTRRERFFRGARQMARLQHQGIVRVIAEEGEHEGHSFFVMEYLAGGDLRQAVREGRISRHECLRILRDVGAALDFAHRCGVVHRDVKPGNILLDGAGRAKLTDFDLVLAHDTTGGTRTGMLGTVIYAAPEVMARAHEASVAADVYGLGMTAIFAFHGTDLTFEVLRDATGIIAGLDTSEKVRAALEKAVDWNPAHRWQSAGEFCAALEEPAETASIPVRAASEPLAAGSLEALGEASDGGSRAVERAPPPSRDQADSFLPDFDSFLRDFPWDAVDYDVPTVWRRAAEGNKPSWISLDELPFSSPWRPALSSVGTGDLDIPTVLRRARAMGERPSWLSSNSSVAWHDLPSDLSEIPWEESYEPPADTPFEPDPSATDEKLRDKPPDSGEEDRNVPEKPPPELPNAFALLWFLLKRPMEFPVWSASHGVPDPDLPGWRILSRTLSRPGRLFISRSIYLQGLVPQVLAGTIAGGWALTGAFARPEHPFLLAFSALLGGIVLAWIVGFTAGSLKGIVVALSFSVNLAAIGGLLLSLETREVFHAEVHVAAGILCGLVTARTLDVLRGIRHRFGMRLSSVFFSGSVGATSVAATYLAVVDRLELEPTRLVFTWGLLLGLAFLSAYLAVSLPAAVASFKKNSQAPASGLHQQRLATAFFSLLPAMVLLLIFALPRYGLADIVVEGPRERITLPEVNRALADEWGRSLFKISLSDVASNLNSHPWVERIELRKELPDRLRVRVVEKKPFALLAMAENDDELFYLDARGGVIARANSTEVSDDWLRIFSQKASAPPFSPLRLRQILGAVDPRLSNGLRSVEVLGSGDLRLELPPLSLTILVNAMHMESQIPRLSALLKPVLELFANPSKEIDLRFDDRAILNFPEESFLRDSSRKP